jgi:hypothetical protein
MSRYKPTIEIDRKYAAMWLKDKGWQESWNQATPFAPSDWIDPVKGGTKHLELAFSTQLIREINH